MGNITQYIGSQFSNPRGIAGKLCCIIMNIMNRPMYAAAAAKTVQSVQTRILDIGYGNGYLIKKIYAASKAHMYGIDISEDMKKLASKKNRRALQQGKLTLETGSCCSLPFEDSTFSTVISVNTIYFWEDTLKGLQEILRTLEDGGVFYNVVYSKKWLQALSYTKTGFQFFEKEDYIAQGKEAGFSEITVADIVKDKSCLIAYRKGSAR